MYTLFFPPTAQEIHVIFQCTIVHISKLVPFPCTVLQYSIYTSLCHVLQNIQVLFPCATVYCVVFPMYSVYTRHFSMYYSLYTPFSPIDNSKYMSFSHVFQYNTASLHMGYSTYVHQYIYTRPFLLFLLSTRLLYFHISMCICYYILALLFSYFYFFYYISYTMFSLSLMDKFDFILKYLASIRE
jgi:hypothetical protein